MEIPADIAMQQASQQLQVSTSMVKNAAKAEKAVVGLIEEAVQSAATATRGQNLDINV